MVAVSLIFCVGAAAQPKQDPPEGCTAAQFRGIVKQLYHPWQQPVANRWRMRRCLGHAQNQKTFRAMKRIRDRQAKGKLKAVNRYRALTPYSACGHRWAVPGYIVVRESRCLWSAYNSSGAAGPYQLMPEWGRPFPVDSFHEKMEHHKIASDLYAGGAGASNWACC